MATMENSVAMKYEKKGEHFEILVDPELAYKYREGKQVSIDDILVYPAIYYDASKLNPEKVPLQKIKEVFGVEDELEAIKIILKEGELPLTTALRKKLTDERRERVISYIVKNAIDIKTGLPIPRQRIENAFEKLRIHVDIRKPFGREVEEIVEKLKGLMPIVIERLEAKVVAPLEDGPKLSVILRKKFEVKKEDWGENFVAIVEVPGGLKDELVNLVNGQTKGKGNVEFK